MSLETRIIALASAIGADIKALLALRSTAAVTVANVSIAPAQYTQAVVNVPDAAVASTSSVLAALAPNADWDADDLADLTLTAQANTGSIDFCIARPGPIVGNFKIIYQLG